MWGSTVLNRYLKGIFVMGIRMTDKKVGDTRCLSFSRVPDVSFIQPFPDY